MPAPKAVLLSLLSDMESPPHQATVVRIGSFNIGVNQSMLTAKTASETVAKIEGIIATCVQDGCLDIFSLCDLGGHRQGLRAAGINHADMRIFRAEVGPMARVDGCYLTAWGFKPDAPQLDLHQWRTHTLSSPACDPQLVIHVFAIAQNSFLIHGNLHTRIPTGSKVSANTKKSEC